MPGKTEITDQEFVENIVKALVDNPDDVLTGRTLDERGVLIQLTVNRADMGKVIGRDGRTAKAIRSLLRVFGARNDARINLKIVDPEGGSADIPEEGSDRAPRRESARREMPEAASAQPIPEAKTEAPSETKEEKATGVI